MGVDKKKQRLLEIITVAVLALLIPVTALLTARTRGRGADVVINEILASNSAFPDPTGQYRDYVELRSTVAQELDLSGYGLTDTAAAKYRFPEGTVLPAGGCIVVWCDAGARDEAGVASFSISKEGGETISLLSPHGRVIDSVETIPTLRNRSMVPDGAGGWTLSDTPTPGFENSPEGHAAYLASRTGGVYTVHISEFMSSNSLYPAPDGNCYDWVELYNSGSAPADLGGWSLSDTAEEAKHYFASGETVPAGGYRVVWLGDGGAGFSLSREGGETLCLLGPNGEVLDRIETPVLEKNQSLALGDDGGWTARDRATPGFENSPEGYEDYLASLGYGECAVRISEAMAENRGCVQDGFGAFSDWIELCNDGAEPADLSGWWLSDDPAEPAKWQIPSLRLEPGAYALVFCDERNTLLDGECHTNFSLSKSGETVLLSAPVGAPAASFTFGALGEDRAAVNTGGEPLVTDAATPGFENSPEGYAAFLGSRTAEGPLVINEVMSTNSRVLRQPDGEYYDWAELRNLSGEAVSLADWALTDDLAQPDRFLFPERDLAPGETLVVLLTGGAVPTANYACAPFALSGQEDWLYLLRPDGSVADYLRVANLPYLGSVGRMEGENGFFYFETPTPGQPNADGARSVAAAPLADVAPGVYDGVENLVVHLSGGGEIRYTTDGSLPTANSKLYDEPITLAKTTVIRARCFQPGSLPGETATLNYVINEGHTLPVVCLALAPADFNGPGGIYQDEYVNKEVYSNLSFFEENGSFSIDCGLTLHGASSRRLFDKKSMKAVFRPRYDGALNYDVFGDGEFTTFASLNLRGGSMPTSYAIVRDEICSTVAIDTSDNILALKTRYCVLYINGNYWGIYALREAYSEKYAADHLGVTEEDIRISRAPVPAHLYPDLASHIEDLEFHSVADEARYYEVAEWLDLESLADWMIIEAWFTNTDIPGNIRYIYSAVDGKWRYAFFDLDNALYSGEVSWEFVFDGANQCGIIPMRMVQNPIFRDQLLRRMAELLSGPLTGENAVAVLEEYYTLLEPEVARESEMWGGGAMWGNSRQGLSLFLDNNRGLQLIRGIVRYLRLTPEEADSYFRDVPGYTAST